MRFSFRRRESAPEPESDREAELERVRRLGEFFRLAARGSVDHLRRFVLELNEIESERMQARLLELGETLGAEERLRRLRSAWESGSEAIAAFAERQKACLREREAELKQIIDILTRAMAAVDLENRDYNRSLLEQGRRLENLTRLDDLKKVKAAVLQESVQLREAVREKEARDQRRIASLSRQVESLRRELETVRREAECDALTGVLNRRAFDRALADWVSRGTARPQDFCLVLVDIDDFKNVNDTYGHLAGDRILCTVARKCAQVLGPGDLLARYGGEEFAVLLAGASLRTGLKKASRICGAVAAARYVLEESPADSGIRLTVSAGVAAWHAGDTAAALIERADRALYRAKTTGKNRAVSEREIAA
ncbi:MAG: diguanylate cyclase [Desulfobacterales bacterium]